MQILHSEKSHYGYFHRWLSEGKLWTVPVVCLIFIFFAVQPWNFDLAKYAGELLCLYALFLMIKEYRSISFRQPEMVLIVSGLLYFLWFCISYWTSGYDRASVDNYLVFLFIAPLLFTLRYTFNRYESVAIVLFMVSLSYLMYVVYMHNLDYQGRWHGDENAVNFGNGMTLYGIISLLLIPSLRSTRLRLLMMLAAGVFLYCAYKSGTRGNILGLFAAGAVVLFVIERRLGFVRPVAICALLLVAVLPFLNWQKINQTYQNTVNYFSEQKDASSSAGQRLALWTYSSCLAVNHPTTGVGPGAFRSAQLANECNPKNYLLRGASYQSHSVYFNTLATAGFPGLIALLVFFISTLIVSYRNYRHKALPLMTAVVTMMGYGLTVDLFFMKVLALRHVIILVLLAAVLYGHYCSRRPESENSYP